jgi:acetyltransferase-like isoleucine patch superfamily enzyme
MSDQLRELAKQLAPYISQELLNQPSVWGDRSRLHLGDDVHVVNTFFNLSCGSVFIGNHAFFGNHCSVLTGTHPINKKNRERHWHPHDGNDIHIGEGVWIASHAIIIGPCKIGDHAVVASGSVLLPGEYEGGYLYAGSPAVKKRKIDFN